MALQVPTEVCSRSGRKRTCRKKLARDRRDELRRQLASGADPSAKRKAEKVAGADSFEAVAREWFAKFSPNWAATPFQQDHPPLGE